MVEIKSRVFGFTTYLTIAWGVKNNPLEHSLKNISAVMQRTKMYSAICSSGFSTTRSSGVSNSIEMLEQVVTKIIIQSRYGTKASSL